MASALGGEANPIALDDEELKVKYNEEIENLRNRQIIEQALMTNNPLELCFAVVRTCIPGDTFTKNRELNRAIQRYYRQKLGIKISHEHFYPRPDPDYSNPDAQPKLTDLVLYGVDFMTTNGIKDRLKAIGVDIKEITWVNDSTCRVVFGRAEETGRVLKTQVQDIKLQDEQQRLRGWYSLKSYYLYSFERSLWARFATSTETLSKQVASKYLKFTEAKAQLAPFLLKHFHAEDRYRETIEDIQSKQRRYRSRSRERKPAGMRHQPQFLQNDKMKEQRSNRFKRRQFQPQQAELPEKKAVGYAHRPVQPESDYHFINCNCNKEKERLDTSFDISPIPIHNPRQQRFNTDFNHPTPSSNQGGKDLDNSFYFENKAKSVRGVVDNFSEMDSEFSMRMPIFKNSLEDQNRMDFNYDPVITRKKHNSLDYQYTLTNKPKNSFKSEELGESFVAHSVRVGPENENFFDFLEDKPKPKQKQKQPTLDTSFRYDKKPKEKPKPINTNFYDDYSY